MSNEIKPVTISSDADGSLLMDHACFGVASIQRKTLEEPVLLLGMETPVKDVMSLTVKGVTVKKDIDEDFYIENQTHVQIMMSSNQFFSAFSAQGQSDYPCSIVETQKMGRIKLIDPPTVANHIKQEIIDDIDNALIEIDAMIDHVEALVTKSGAIKRGEREEANDAFFRFTKPLFDSVPHNLECFSEIAEQQFSESKSTVELSLTNKKDKIISRIAKENNDFLRIDKE